MVISALDSDKVLVHTPGIDIDTHVWLRKMGYQIVEADLEEQIKHSAAAAVTLEPGHVMMHARAAKTIAAVRKVGVEVTPIDYDEYNKYGAAIVCAAMLILRDPGPRKFS
jgi:N-dimethylarginine dimethylaminohydrolase